MYMYQILIGAHFSPGRGEKRESEGVWATGVELRERRLGAGMQSFTHPLHSGAAAALLSATPSSSAILTTREPVLIANCRIAVMGGTGNCLRHNQGFGLGFGCGVNLKLQISVSEGVVVSCVSFGIRTVGGARRAGVNWATALSRVRGAVVMQGLLTATHRQIQVDIKTNGPCLACRSSSSSSNGTGGEESDKRAEPEESPPQDVVLKAISEVSKSEGRIGKTTNMVIGGTVKKDSESEWNAIDQKVNVYPMVRDFTAIGTGGDEFVQAMVQAVESVTETPVPKVTKKLSSQGKYVSVKIGGITVTSSEQVRAVYDAMRKDVRMKYFL